jgi:preprotein translocase subunit SecG
MIYGLLTGVHILICVFLVIVVLLQSGKAADLAGAFGGMGSQTTFGPRGSVTALSRATTVAAVLFMFTSLTLAIMASGGTRAVGSSVLQEQRSKPASSVPAPARPAPSAPTGVPSVAVPGGKPIPMPLPPLSKPAPPAQAPAAPAPAKK